VDGFILVRRRRGTTTTSQVIHEMNENMNDRNEHREKFNLEAFQTTFQPNDKPIESTKTRRKVYTKKEYDEIWRLVKYWDVIEGHFDPIANVHVTQAALRKSGRRNWCNDRIRYRIEPVTVPGGEQPVEHLQHYDGKRDAWRVVIHQEMVFDAIYNCHIAVHHQKKKKTWELAVKVYDNITEDLCKIFIDGCPTCCGEQRRVVFRRSDSTGSQFRDVYTACVVDYSTTPATDVNGHQMGFVLVLRDNETKFIVLRPIEDTSPMVLQYELSLMFATLGGPRRTFVFEKNSDFESVLVDKIVQDWSYDCVNETGKADDIVLQVKSEIDSLLLKYNEAMPLDDDDDSYDDKLRRQKTWLQLVPEAMREINQQSYPKVFGIEYTPSSSCIDAQTKVKDDVPNMRNEEASGILLSLVQVNDEDGSSKKGPEKQMHVTTIGVSDHGVCGVEGNDMSDRSTSLSMELAGKNTKVMGEENVLRYPKLMCSRCASITGIGENILWVAGDDYYRQYATGTRWWPVDLITTFGFLKAHEKHNERTIFIGAGAPTRREHHKRTNTIRLPDRVDSIVSVAIKDSHFVVLEMKVEPACTTVVYDGRSKDMKDIVKWEEHEEYVLSRYGISKTINQPREWRMRYYDPIRDFSQMLKLDQKDDHNCGPIACRVLWELLAPGEVDIKYGYKRNEETEDSTRSKASKDASVWREMVVTELTQLVKKYRGQMVEKKKKRKFEGKSNQDRTITI
jgi:hypothetical protein